MRKQGLGSFSLDRAKWENHRRGCFSNVFDVYMIAVNADDMLKKNSEIY